MFPSLLKLIPLEDTCIFLSVENISIVFIIKSIWFILYWHKKQTKSMLF